MTQYRLSIVQSLVVTDPKPSISRLIASRETQRSSRRMHQIKQGGATTYMYEREHSVIITDMVPTDSHDSHGWRLRIEHDTAGFVFLVMHFVRQVFIVFTYTHDNYDTPHDQDLSL